MLLAWLLLSLAGFGVPLAAQDNSDANAPADSQLAGTVGTPDGTAIPGATLRVIETSTGKAWITWTDEDGKFEFPALPAGHYRVEISQLGFAHATKEVDLTSGTQAPIDLKLDVGALAAITAPIATENAAKTPSAPLANESAKSTPPGAPAAGGAAPAILNSTTTAAINSATASPAGRNGGNGGQRGGGGRNGQQGGAGGNVREGGRRAFQQVGLNGQSENSGEIGTEDQSIPESGGQLGQAASADAVQMIGTVAMGLMPPGGFPQPGDGGPDTRGGFGNGENAIPGQAAPAAGLAAARAEVPESFIPRGGGGRGRGPQGGPQGVDALWGEQRLTRQRINRTHYSFYDTFGDSAINARPYSLYEANPPKISSWTESAGFNMGGTAENPARVRRQ